MSRPRCCRPAASCGIALVPYSPLGRGFLTGAIRSADQLAANDWRRVNPRFQDGHLAQNLALADAIVALARDHGLAPAQLALAWLLDRGPDIVPIPGTRSTARLEENAMAARLRLNDVLREELHELLDAFPRRRRTVPRGVDGAGQRVIAVIPRVRGTRPSRSTPRPARRGRPPHAAACR